MLSVQIRKSEDFQILRRKVRPENSSKVRIAIGPNPWGFIISQSGFFHDFVESEISFPRIWLLNVTLKFNGFT